MFWETSESPDPIWITARTLDKPTALTTTGATSLTTPVRRNQLIERWAGQEWALRQQRADAVESVQKARQEGNPEEARLFYGQDAGLINDIPSAGDLVARIVNQAEDIITSDLPPASAN